jgi:hypothetical protein
MANGNGKKSRLIRKKKPINLAKSDFSYVLRFFSINWPISGKSMEVNKNEIGGKKDPRKK